MLIYKYGKIMHVNTNYLILDHNGEGELIYVPNIERFKKDEVRKIFISHIQNEYNNTTYGFDNFKELVIFEDLISLQGIGPKIAISILNEGWEKIIAMVANEDKEALQEINYVSGKIANNIIFNFKDKYAKFLEKLEGFETYKMKKVTNNFVTQFEDTMKMLGFKNPQIQYALDKMEINENIEKCVEHAIKLISQNQNEIRI